MRLQPEIFQQLVLTWFDKHGRKNLPWQHPRTPYRVWLSEIMLQQTQVTTVIPYFEKFIAHFPQIEILAQASLDLVLSLWAGLGYYARARNLHRTAQIVTQHYQGQFPETLAALQQLPGIGRSTAGAILALGFNQAAPILDGNVKRVLARIHALPGWPGIPSVNQAFWSLATQYTPQAQAAAYTQAMMDLGSLVCTRSQPHCKRCPLSAHCLAYAQGQTQAYPTAKPRKTLPIRRMQYLILVNAHQEILLEKRPPIGIWGGLWSLPECSPEVDITVWCQTHYHCHLKMLSPQPPLRHSFTHFHLEILPVICTVQHWNPPLQDNAILHWHTQAQWQRKGLAAPIKKLLIAYGNKLL